MIIKYSKEDKSYYLCDLGDGSGTFVRLDIPIVIIRNRKQHILTSYYIIDFETWIYYFFW